MKVDRYIELNHKITQDMVTFPGASLARFEDWQPRFSNNALLDQATLLGITGTYIDAPFHADPDGCKISDYPLEKLVNLPIVVITKPESRRAFELEDFRGVTVKGCAVLLCSGHDRFFGSEKYAEDVPYLDLEAARWLVAHEVALVGIDSPIVDDFASQAAHIPVHGLLLAHGIVISEDMTNLGALPENGAYLTVVPPRVPMASFPVRAFATVFV